MALKILIFAYLCNLILNHRLMKHRFLAFLMAFVPLLLYAADFVEKKGISYRDGESRCVMDIYYPEENTTQKPVIVWFHGGGLTGGERFIPEQLKTGDYVVVAPGYRLLPNATLDDCIDDAAAVTAWVMDNIADYGGNPNEIFLSGHSAGGYLISLVGLDKRRLEKYGKNADDLAGLIPFSGQAITHYAYRELNGLSPLTPTIDEFSPLFYVRKDAPPYVIISGDREQELYGRYEENAYLWRMMKLVGHPYVYIYELDGYNHGDMEKAGHHILKKHIKDILNNR